MTNIAELLRNAPKGLKLYSPLFGEVAFGYIGSNDTIWVCLGNSMRMFSSEGRYRCSIENITKETPECLLFPSKDCRTWGGWKLPVEPKFKVGDKVIYGGKERTITFMDDKFYGFDGGCAGCRIELQDELLRPAPKPHYDIGNFHAGMPVMVRETSLNAWQYVHFSHCYIGGDGLTRFNAGLVGFTQCVPFNNDTKHLLGTTDQCDERFINW